MLRDNSAQRDVDDLRTQVQRDTTAAMSHHVAMSSPATWNIPTVDGSTFPISLSPGDTAVFVGANGTGKSALSHWLHKQAPESVPVVRLLAHRRLWMSSSGPETTPSSYSSFVSILAHNDLDPTSRYRDESSEQRSAGILFRLMSAESERNSQVAKMVARGTLPKNLDPSPLERISHLLQIAGLELTFQVGLGMSFVAERNGLQYPIEQMSDGEKAGFLLATEIVLAEADSVIILDEPERHLHRSISGHLIFQMVAERPDCRFVVFTHDVDLADRLRQKSAPSTIVRSVAWDGPDASGWTLEQLPTGAPIPEKARHALLGGRDRILFVEGTAASLDSLLYETLFANWSIQTGGSCRDVIQTVSGLQRAPELHWITAAGIVDGDARTPAEASGLERQRVFSLPVNEVESLYFLPEIIQKMAEWQARQLNLSSDTLLDDALEAGISKLSFPDVQSNLAAANAEKILRRQIQSKAPSKSEIHSAGSSISIKVNSPYKEQLDALKTAIENRDWETLVINYSVRDTPALDAISKALQYPNRSIYQQAVLGRMRDDTDFLEVLRTKFPSFIEP